MPLHGTPARYAQGCSCNLCVLVDAIYGPPKHTASFSKVDAAPARRHITALRAAGWRIQEIADRTGYHESTIRAIGVGRTKTAADHTVTDICSIPIQEVAA